MSLTSGHSAALTRFRACVEAERVAQAYLVLGPPQGAGSAFAREALGLLYCEADNRPCGLCSSCRYLAANTHPDVTWVEPRKKSRIIDIALVREITQRMSRTSMAGGWKACVLVHADRLRDAAANAFLKTLEEPEGRTIFLLLTDAPHALLPTVMSRCQRVLLGGSSGEPDDADWRDEIVDALYGLRRFPEDVLGRMVRCAHVGGVLSRLKKAAAKQAAAEASESDDKETIDARTETLYRGRRSEVLRTMVRWYRDVLLCIQGQSQDLLHYPARAEAIRDEAQSMQAPAALASIEAIEHAALQYERNLNDDTVLAATLSRLATL